MSSLQKKDETKFVDPRTGKRTTLGACPDATRKVGKSRKWYGYYTDADGIDRVKALAADKAVARQLLAELEREVERGRAGLGDSFARHRKTPLADHVEAFGRHLAAKGRKPKYVGDTLARVKTALVGDCRFRLVGDLDGGTLASRLADYREDGLGATTSNHYLRACKMFSRWLVKDRRIAEDPFAHLDGVNARTDVRKARRDLPLDELSRLIAATEAGPTRYGLNGPDRAMLYRVAVFTGLRASELATMTVRSFDLDGDPPTFTLSAAATKNRKAVTLPLNLSLVDDLRPWLAERVETAAGDVIAFPGVTTSPRADAGTLWPGGWAKHGHAARMIRADLDTAGVPYTDEDGRDFDFHALRHQFITMLARSGVNVKDAQELARHSTVTLTLDRYAHVGIRDLGTAVAALPRIDIRKTASATGTDAVDRGPSEGGFRSPTTPQTTPTWTSVPSINKSGRSAHPERRIPNPQVTCSNHVGGVDETSACRLVTNTM